MKKKEKKIHQIDVVYPKHIYYAHIARNACFGVLMILGMLGVGMMGYHHFEKVSWIDAFLSASMILSGMGPVGTLTSTAGKLFAGFYALFSGLVFIVSVGVIFAPVMHRFFKRIHLDDEVK